MYVACVLGSDKIAFRSLNVPRGSKSVRERERETCPLRSLPQDGQEAALDKTAVRRLAPRPISITQEKTPVKTPNSSQGDRIILRVEIPSASQRAQIRKTPKSASESALGSTFGGFPDLGPLAGRRNLNLREYRHPSSYSENHQPHPMESPGRVAMSAKRFRVRPPQSASEIRRTPTQEEEAAQVETTVIQLLAPRTQNQKDVGIRKELSSDRLDCLHLQTFEGNQVHVGVVSLFLMKHAVLCAETLLSHTCHAGRPR